MAQDQFKKHRPVIKNWKGPLKSFGEVAKSDKLNIVNGGQYSPTIQYNEQALSSTLPLQLQQQSAQSFSDQNMFQISGRPSSHTRRLSSRQKQDNIGTRPASALQKTNFFSPNHQGQSASKLTKNQFYSPQSIQNFFWQSKPVTPKNVTKIMPNAPKQSRQELYAKVLTSKIESNALRSENQRLQTRLAYIQSKVSQKDQTGQVTVILKHLQEQKLNYDSKLCELKEQQKLVQMTQIEEILTETEIYQQEMVRLRQMLQDTLTIQQKQQNEDKSQLDEALLKLNKMHGLELEYESVKKLNASQSKQIAQLDLKLKANENNYQEQMQIISADLKQAREEQIQVIEKQNLISQQKSEEHARELEELKQNQQYELEQLLAQQEEQYKSQIASYQEDLVRVKSETEQLIYENQLKLEEQLSEKQDEIEQLQIQLSGKDKQIHQLELRNVELNSRIAQLERIQEETNECNTYQLNELVLSHKQIIQANEQVLRKLEEESADKLNILQRVISDLQDSNQDLNSRVNYLQQQLDASKKVVQQSPKLVKVISGFDETFERDESNIAKSVQSQNQIHTSQIQEKQRSRNQSRNCSRAQSCQKVVENVGSPIQMSSDQRNESSQYTSEGGANYRVEIDSTAVRNQIQQNPHFNSYQAYRTEEDDFINLPLQSESYGQELKETVAELPPLNSIQTVQEQHNEQNLQTNEEVEEILTAQSGVIRDCLYIFKRACQFNKVTYDKIEIFMFGQNYVPEEKISMEDLDILLQNVLKIPSYQSHAFSKYLVESASNRSSPTPQKKALKCHLITTLTQNVSMYCNGLQLYGPNKEQKMKLIVGQALNFDNLQVKDFDELGSELTELGIGRETLDCALVYLLKMSENYCEINQEILFSFVEECKQLASVLTQTGMNFPIQEDLLEHSKEQISDKNAEQYNNDSFAADSRESINEQQKSEQYSYEDIKEQPNDKKIQIQNSEQQSCSSKTVTRLHSPQIVDNCDSRNSVITNKFLPHSGINNSIKLSAEKRKVETPYDEIQDDLS